MHAVAVWKETNFVKTPRRLERIERYVSTYERIPEDIVMTMKYSVDS
jgi:hypothetical protein